MKGLRDGRGVTLAETMIAVLIAVIGVFALGNVIYQATVTNKNQGTEATRAVIYAQDKLEFLLSLGAAGPVNTTTANYNTCTQPVSTPQPSVCNTTGITDSGWTTGLVAPATVPIVPTAATTTPVAYDCPTTASGYRGYLDFLNANGQQLAGACSTVTGSQIAYIREWTIADLTAYSGPAQKQVTVAVYSTLSLNTGSGKPIVVVTSVLTNPN